MRGPNKSTNSIFMAVLYRWASFGSPMTCRWRLVHHIRPAVRPVKSRFVISRQLETAIKPLVGKNGGSVTLARKSEVVVIPYTAASQKSFSDREGSYW
jgi:hypothetical protein